LAAAAAGFGAAGDGAEETEAAGFGASAAGEVLVMFGFGSDMTIALLRG
jgi:hypothetical protein